MRPSRPTLEHTPEQLEGIGCASETIGVLSLSPRPLFMPLQGSGPLHHPKKWILSDLFDAILLVVKVCSPIVKQQKSQAVLHILSRRTTLDASTDIRNDGKPNNLFRQRCALSATALPVGTATLLLLFLLF